MAKPQPSKLMLWVRFPSPAPFKLIHSSSVVELSAVNRSVVGSSPTCGAIWPRGQAVKTPPFHGGNTGSSPVGVIQTEVKYRFCFFNSILESCPSWPKEHAWKVCRRHKRLEGSNPSLSVNSIKPVIHRYLKRWYNGFYIYR